MSDSTTDESLFELPDDLVTAVRELSEKLGESPRDIVITAVDHFTRLPDDRRRAILKGTSLRRRP
jgi:predicted transcriptional regulator